jgi:hypothetical protein
MKERTIYRLYVPLVSMDGNQVTDDDAEREIELALFAGEAAAAPFKPTVVLVGKAAPVSVDNLVAVVEVLAQRGSIGAVRVLAARIKRGLMLDKVTIVATAAQSTEV